MRICKRFVAWLRDVDETYKKLFNLLALAAMLGCNTTEYMAPEQPDAGPDAAVSYPPTQIRVRASLWTQTPGNAPVGPNACVTPDDLVATFAETGGQIPRTICTSPQPWAWEFTYAADSVRPLEIRWTSRYDVCPTSATLTVALTPAELGRSEVERYTTVVLCTSN